MVARRWLPPERTRILAFAALAAALLAAAPLLAHGWSEDAVRAVVRGSAKLGVVLFSSAFAASSIRTFWRSPASGWLLRNRRYVGLSFALLHLLHLLALVALAAAFPTPFLDELSAVTLVGGGVAYLFVAAQAATSNDAAVRWLGRARWSRLHTVGSYYIWAIFTLSYLPRAIEQASYVPYGALLLAVLGLRIACALRLRARQPAPGEAAGA